MALPIDPHGYVQHRHVRVQARGPVILAVTGFLVLLTTTVGTGVAQDRDRVTRLAQASKGSAAAATVFQAGRDLIAEEQWDRAVETFTHVIRQYPKGHYVEASLYWLAFALNKQRKVSAADSMLARLITEFPQSPWITDARVLRVELALQLGKGELVIEEASQATDEEIKFVALQSLFQANPERAMTVVIELVKPGSHVSRRVKERAILLLGQYRGEQAVPMLIDIARQDADPLVRKQAIYWLTQTQDEGAWELFKELALTSEEYDIAKAALFALSQGGPRASAVLSELARTAQALDVRKQAIFWLSQRVTRTDSAESDTIIAELMKIYEANANVELRKQILFALAQRGSQRAYAKLLDIARTGDNLEIRQQAIFWLAQRGGASIEDLIQLYDAERSGASVIKERILFTLSQSREQAALRKLMLVAKSDPSMELRKKAIFWLGQSKDPEAMQWLEELLK